MKLLTRALILSLGLWLPAVAGAATPSASSEAVSEEDGKRAASLAFDGLLSTSWAEGESGNGEGAWLELRFDRPVDVSNVSIWPGDLSGRDTRIRETPRPRLATLSIDVGAEEPIVLPIRFDDPAKFGPVRLDVPVDAPQARSLRLTIDAVYDGGMYSDMHVAEMAVNFVGGSTPKVLDDHLAWLQGDASAKAREAVDAEARSLLEAIEAEEFGDRESLAVLMEYAIDGAPFVRERLPRIPYGFRMAANPAHTKSLEFLLTVKDPNAIPAVSRAGVRSTGALQAHLQKTTKMFMAYQDLKGGGKRNVAPWGEQGFSKGALQSFGEPLDIAVDTFGGVWVADVGNHRVQRYRIDTGGFDKAFGAEPEMTDVWFERTRQHYAAGARPGTAKGEFTNPVAVAVKYGKEGDTVAVLDAKGRVSVITPDDTISHVVELPVTSSIVPGQGGEGHLVFAKKRLVAIWGDEAYRVDPETWTVDGDAISLEDGVPSGAVGFKNGKLGLVYGGELVLYSADGFRFGSILGDTLGTGHQDWAVATDEKGKLWVVTDKGEAIKYKKPGSVDFRVPFVTYSLSSPRLAVFDDLVFVTHDDKIIQADALQLKLDAEAEGPATGTLDVGSR